VHLDSAAAGIEAQPEVALGITREIVETLVLARLVEGRAEWTATASCNAIGMFHLWARAARQPKLRALQAQIDRDIESGRVEALARVWHAWRDCRQGEHLSLGIDRSARRLVDYLLACGIPRSALVVVRPDVAGALGQQMAALRLPTIDVYDRPGRAVFRLQLSEPDVSAAACSGASLSVVGLHWEMVLLGSLLIAHEVM